MRFERLGLDEWVHRWTGVGTNLDISGMPSPYQEFLPEVEWGQSPLELERRLLELISSLYGVEEDRVALTFGAQNANSLAMMTQLSSGDLVVSERPIYEPMRVVAEALCSVIDLPRRRENDFAIDIDELHSLMRGASMLMITNLHNPTAAVLGDDILATIAEVVEDRGALLLCDEIYREMSYHHPPRPAHDFPEVGVTTNGMTKLYGLGDLRVGWLIGPQEVAEAVDAARRAMAWNLPSHSMALAISALERKDWFRERMLELARGNLKLLKRWSSREERARFRWPDGALMFSLELPEGIDDMAFSETLLSKYDTAVCPGSYFGAPGQVRVTFSCAASKFERGLENISLAMDHLS